MPSIVKGHPAKPLVLIGTHHKTGTVLARKVFKLICKKANLACDWGDPNAPWRKDGEIVHVGNVDIVLDMHWRLDPEAVAQGRPYKFVHFVRTPLKKIVSGYLYHLRGSEPWLKLPEQFASWCNSSSKARLGEAGNRLICKEMTGPGMNNISLYSVLNQRSRLEGTLYYRSNP
jgi:hypothetical protein